MGYEVCHWTSSLGPIVVVSLGGRSPSRHPPLHHCDSTRAALALAATATNAFLYSHPMAHRGFVLFIAGPVREKQRQRSTIATKAPPDSLPITIGNIADEAAHLDLTLRSITQESMLPCEGDEQKRILWPWECLGQLARRCTSVTPVSPSDHHGDEMRPSLFF